MPSNVLNGTSIIVKTGTAGSETEILFSTNASLTLSMDTRDISNKGSSGWRELLEAQMSWSVSTEGLLAFKNAAGSAVKNYDDLVTDLVARPAFQILITPETTTTLDYTWTGECFITSVEQSAPLEDSSTWSATFEGTGALTQAVV